MKINKLFIIAMAFVIAICVVMFVVTSQPKKESIHYSVTQSDPVATTISSLRHQGKLVVTDANIRAETKSHIDSSIWDASVSSSSTARVQVFLDLSMFRKEWVSQNGNDLLITIPKSFITTEVILTGEEHHPNESWAFTFEGGEEKNLEDVNHKHLLDQLREESTPMIEESIPMVQLQILRLFTVALWKTPYHVKVSVDTTK